MATKKTEAELLAEAERKAEAALAQMPEPVQEYASGPPEQEEEQAQAELAVAVEAEDQRSDRSDRERLERLERMIEQLMTNLPQQQAAPLVIPAAPDELPHRAKQWTAGELEELVTVTIFPETNPNENRPVDVNLNGVKYILPRGVPTRTPRKVALVLEQAVIDSWEYPVENGRYLAQKTELTTLTTTPPVHRRLPRFNFAYS